MKVKYIGDPRDDHSGPDTIKVHGIEFQKNQTVSVDDEIGAKLATNSHFETTPAKGDKNTRRTAADAVEDADEAEAVIGSTTGDPETMSRETRMAIAEQGREEPTDPMGEVGPDSGSTGKRK